MCGLRRSNYVLRKVKCGMMRRIIIRLSSSPSCLHSSWYHRRCHCLSHPFSNAAPSTNSSRAMKIDVRCFLPALYLFVYLLLCFVYSQGVHKFVWRSGEDLHDNWWVINTAVARRRVSTSLQGADYEDPHKSTLTMNNYMKMRLRQALDKMRNIRKQLGLSQRWQSCCGGLEWQWNPHLVSREVSCRHFTLTPRFAGFSLGSQLGVRPD